MTRTARKQRKPREETTWHYFCDDPTCIPSEAMEHLCYTICALMAAIDQRLSSLERMGGNQWKLLGHAERLLCVKDEIPRPKRRKAGRK